MWTFIFPSCGGLRPFRGRVSLTESGRTINIAAIICAFIIILCAFARIRSTGLSVSCLNLRNWKRKQRVRTMNEKKTLSGPYFVGRCLFVYSNYRRSHYRTIKSLGEQQIELNCGPETRVWTRTGLDSQPESKNRKSIIFTKWPVLKTLVTPYLRSLAILPEIKLIICCFLFVSFFFL